MYPYSLAYPKKIVLLREEASPCRGRMIDDVACTELQCTGSSASVVYTQHESTPTLGDYMYHYA